MFGNFAALGGLEDNIPKRPPPPATPLQFPSVGLKTSQSRTKATYDELYRSIVSFPRQGPTINHLKTFNISLVEDTSLENLVPPRYIPPPSWLHPSTVDAPSQPSPTSPSSPSKTFLSNNAPSPEKASFQIRLQELLYPNDDAFDFLKRKPLPPEKGVRLAQYRKFWDRLYAIAEYWDTSKDNYIPASASADGDEKYTGRRIDCGAKMPNSYREAAVNAFVETIAWEFKCRVELPSTEPRLGVQMMRVPVPLSGAVYRSPSDRNKAKRGILEGPLLGISSRMGVEFRKDGEGEGEGRMECLDLLREIGAALLIAQKRRREGMVEKKAWEGKWWAEKRRWGGGEGGEVKLSELSSSDTTPPTTKERRNLEQWKKLKPPSSEWDKNVEYIQIGKQQNTEYDNIYLLSSLNHHLSILHVRIPDAYIDLLTNGPSSETFIPAQHPWFKLHVQRSKWYDLLNPDDRAQAMRGVWGVIAWMMRSNEGVEEERDVEMTDQE